MKKAHYSFARLLWNSTAYCDQFQKILAIFDEDRNLRIVIAENDACGACGACDVLLLGDDDEKILYRVCGLEIGSTTKNMAACFKLYVGLRNVNNPEFVGCSQNKTRVKSYKLLTHTRAGACRHGGFKAIDDAAAQIGIAQEAMEKAVADSQTTASLLYLDDDHGRHEDDDCSFDSWLDGITGGNPYERRMIMSGVFDD